MSDSDSEEQPLPAIHAAVRDLDVDALRRALAAGANVDALYSGKTPLFVVCQASPPAAMTTIRKPAAVAPITVPVVRSLAPASGAGTVGACGGAGALGLYIRWCEQHRTAPFPFSPKKVYDYLEEQRSCVIRLE